MASSSDKFIKTVQAPPSKLAGPIGPDTETIPLQTLEGWSSTTAVVVAIDRYDDATGEITPSKTEIVVGTLGPNGLENVERGVGGTRQNHSDGAVAEISIAAGEQWNRAMDALIGALGQDGKIKGEMIVPGSVGPGALNWPELGGRIVARGSVLSPSLGSYKDGTATTTIPAQPDANYRVIYSATNGGTYWSQVIPRAQGKGLNSFTTGFYNNATGTAAAVAFDYIVVR